MDSIIQERFDRLETALNSLVESITYYNPSVAAAATLLEADEHLSQGLEQLARHQKNYHTLVALRATTESLDNRIKSTLSVLGDARKELLNSASAISVSSTPQRPIDHDELLGFAQRIARFTVPPTYRPPLPPPIEPSAAVPDSTFGRIRQETATKASSNAQYSTQTSNGAVGAPSIGETPQGQSESQPSHLGAASAEGKAISSLPTAVKAWLEPPSSRMQFVPWPEEEAIRRGALGRIETSWNIGADPSNMDIANEAFGQVEDGEAADSRRRSVDDERKDSATFEQPARRRSSRRDSHVRGGVRKEEESDAFDDLNLYNPDDE